MPLDTANLTPAASLNRVPFVPLPGLPFPAEYTDKSAFDLLSSQALAARVQRHGQQLCLELEDGRDPLLAFDRCFLSGDLAVRQLAEQIAESIGQALGYLVLTLKRGDDISRAKRPEWDDSYWAQWGQVNQVWLGGGTVSGLLGQRLAKHAQNFINASGSLPCRVAVSPYKNLMPLFGLARYMPLGTLSALVFDCGASSTKRAAVQYRESCLSKLRAYPSIPMPYGAFSPDSLGQATIILEHLLDVICRTHGAVSGDAIDTIGLCLACYLQHGQPFDKGCYGSLRLVSDDLQCLLVAELTRRLKKTIRVILMHDGTAAAAAHAGKPQAAVVMLGTALGLGFPAPEALPIRVDPIPLTNSSIAAKSEAD